MASSWERDRISVDLRGIGDAVTASATACAMTRSQYVRAVLAERIQAPSAPSSNLPGVCIRHDQVRLSMRMDRGAADVLRSRAHAAALPLGDYIAALVDGDPAALGVEPRKPLATALVESCSVLSSLARDLRHLAQLLAHGQVRAAQEYRQTLDHLEDDVTRHLKLASEIMSDLDALRSYRRLARVQGV